MLYPLSYEGGRPGRGRREGRSVRPDTDTSIQGQGAYYALGMTAPAMKDTDRLVYLPDVASTRFYLGALALLSVLQYFIAESAVIGVWAGPEPYSRRTGYISDLGALYCGVFDGRDVCSPARLLMNASFVVQGLGMMVGALLLSTALLGTAARPGALPVRSPGRRLPRAVADTSRLLAFAAGSGTVIVGLVPEDAGSGLHLAGAVLYFAAGGASLVLLGGLWLRKSPLGAFILLGGAVSLTALVAGGVTGMEVPEPGTLERLMGYPITIGFAAAGLVLAQRVRQERMARKLALARGAAAKA